jgi:3-hydroxyacyl-[acyl-carrier-protein] dehydratase
VTTIQHADIKRILPHRHPILQLDRVVELEPGKRIVATKAISGCEPCFADLDEDAEHAYPVSLLVESMGQAGGVLWLHSAALEGEPRSGTLIFGSAREVTLAGAAYPGDVITHVVELESVKGDNAFMRGETRVGDRLIMSVESMLAVLREDTELAQREGEEE